MCLYTLRCLTDLMFDHHFNICPLSPSCSVPESKPLQADSNVNGHANPAFLLKKQNQDCLVKTFDEPVFFCRRLCVLSIIINTTNLCFSVHLHTGKPLSSSQPFRFISVQKRHWTSSRETPSCTCTLGRAEGAKCRASETAFKLNTETVLSSGSLATSF